MRFTGTLSNEDRTWSARVTGRWELRPNQTDWFGTIEVEDGGRIPFADGHRLEIDNDGTIIIRIRRFSDSSASSSPICFEGAGPPP
jgi:hypothetical protein